MNCFRISVAVILIISGLMLNSVGIKSSDYSRPETCQGCHAEIYSQWNGSLHSVAHKDIAYQKLFLIASMETNRSFDEFCTKCHSPIAILSGEKPTYDDYAVSEIAESGVSCDFCHTVNASNGIGNGAFVSSPGDIKYGTLNDSNYSTFHKTAYSELHTRAEFCGMCHDVYHPFNNLSIENTYTEWKEGPYNETTPCQHCHMTPGVTEFRQNPGRAAAGGPVRGHISTHYFVGGNALIPGLLGSQEHERLSRERLQAAARLEIMSVEEINDSMSLKVKVINSGAGHKLPTGLTEARMIWLDVDVRDTAGNSIFRSGEMDKDGYVDKKAVIYHTVFGDSEGKPTLQVWFADRILLDNRIPPKGYSLENYTFNIPHKAKWPLDIDIRLNYISASQEVADKLFGKGKVRPPIIEMERARKSFDIPFREETTKEIPGMGSIVLLGAFFSIYMGMKLLCERKNSE